MSFKRFLMNFCSCDVNFVLLTKAKLKKLGSFHADMVDFYKPGHKFCAHWCLEIKEHSLPCGHT